MNKSTTTMLIALALAAGAYYAYTQGMFGPVAGTAIAPTTTIILQTSPGAYTATITASQLTALPALGGTFSYGGSSYQLSSGANGQLFGTLI